MAEAVLRVRTEGGAEVQSLVDRLDRAVSVSRTRRVRGARDAAQQEATHYRESARKTADDIDRSDRLVTRRRLRQLALTDEARRKSETTYAIMLNRATRAHEAEVGKRGELTEKEKRQVHDLASAMLVEHERAERAKTAATAAEAQKRQRARIREARETEGRAGRAIGAALQAGGRFASEVHSLTQDARERRAETGHTLNGAFYQAGVGGAEGQAMRQMLEREVSSPQGSLRGLRLQDVAGSISAAQTQFSVLSGSNAGERMQNLQRQIEHMALARNTYQDPGEVLRVAGMLQQQGIRGADQRSTMLALTGMAQAGSIELSTLTSTALGPLMANISRATNGNMTPAQRAAAVRATTAETMAVGELGAAAGLTPRDSLNALAKLRSSVTSETTQTKLYDRLRASHRGDLAEQLFQAGPGGRHTLRDADAVNLMSSLVRGFGGNANAVNNLLSAGGPGSPMVLDAQQRRLITAMASQTEGGQSIAQRVAAMQAVGGRFGEADVNRGQSMRDAEDLTALTQGREEHDSALTDNTSAIMQLSNAFHDFSVRNPIASSGLSAAGGLLGSLGGGALTRWGGGLVGRLATGTALRTAGMGALGTAGTWLAGGLSAAAAGLGVGYGINRAMGHNSDADNPFKAAFYRDFATSVRDAVRDGLHGATVNATISEHDAVHAATAATTRGQRAP